MNCPNCGSKHLQKKGKRLGRQRYKCLECTASFTKGIPYKPAPKYKPVVNVECPYCGSSQVRRDGQLEQGGQRYKCNLCQKSFSSKTNTELFNKMDCPYCGSKLNYAGYTKLKNRKYHCPTCNRTCSGDENGIPIKREIFSSINTKIRCPNCGSLNLKKAGYINGIQKYVCKDCKRVFMENTPVLKKYKECRTQIIEAVLDGQNYKKVAAKYNYHPDHVRRLLRPYYKLEVIFKKQKELILKYGVHLRVPVDYLAEYVHCSEYNCRKIIENYKKNLII